MFKAVSEKTSNRTSVVELPGSKKTSTVQAKKPEPGKAVHNAADKRNSKKLLKNPGLKRPPVDFGMPDPFKDGNVESKDRRKGGVNSFEQPRKRDQDRTAPAPKPVVAQSTPKVPVANTVGATSVKAAALDPARQQIRDELATCVKNHSWQELVKTPFRVDGAGGKNSVKTKPDLLFNACRDAIKKSAMFAVVQRTYGALTPEKVDSLLAPLGATVIEKRKHSMKGLTRLCKDMMTGLFPDFDPRATDPKAIARSARLAMGKLPAEILQLCRMAAEEIRASGQVSPAELPTSIKNAVITIFHLNTVGILLQAEAQAALSSSAASTPVLVGSQVALYVKAALQGEAKAEQAGKAGKDRANSPLDGMTQAEKDFGVALTECLVDYALTVTTNRA